MGTGDYEGVVLLLMVEFLRCLKDPKLWELWHIAYYGNAGCISSTVQIIQTYLHIRPETCLQVIFASASTPPPRSFSDAGPMCQSGRKLRIFRAAAFVKVL